LEQVKNINITFRKKPKSLAKQKINCKEKHHYISNTIMEEEKNILTTSILGI